MPTSVGVVDDDKRLVAALVRELEARGYDVWSSASGAGALELLGNQHVDVLLCDLRMAGTDGMDLLLAARTLSPKTKSILMSAFATADDYKKAISLGAVEVLTKPFAPDDMIAAIEKAVDCEQGFRGSLHGIALTDVLQMLHFARRSVTVKLDGAAAIHMREGEIIHAEYESNSGLEALAGLLATPSGTVETDSLQSCTETINSPFERLLLDTLTKVDEGGNTASAEHPGQAAISPDDDIEVDRAFAEVIPDSKDDDEPVNIFKGLQASLRSEAVQDRDSSEDAAQKRVRRRRMIWLWGGISCFFLGATLVIALGPKFDGDNPIKRSSARLRGERLNRLRQQQSSPSLKEKSGSSSVAKGTGRPSAGDELAFFVDSNPSGVEIVDAKTKNTIGSTPLRIALKPTRFPFRIRARYQGKLSEEKIVAERPHQNGKMKRIILDLRDWVALVASPQKRRPKAKSKRVGRRRRRRTTSSASIVRRDRSVSDGVESIPSRDELDRGAIQTPDIGTEKYRERPENPAERPINATARDIETVDDDKPAIGTIE